MSIASKLYPLEKARAIVEKEEFAEPPREYIPVAQALWRIVASKIEAERDVPERPLAAMDGFAVRSSDVARGVKIRVVGRTYPGSNPAPLKEGEAVEVSTGAPIPEGADAVVRREASKVVGGFLETVDKVWPGKDVFPPGEFVSKGEVLAERGEVLTPYKLSLLLQAGVDYVEVYRVRATIILASDVSRPETPAKASGKGRDNTSPMIAGLMPWAEVRVIGPLPGGSEELEEALNIAARTSDIIVTIGRASVGPEDSVKDVILKRGELLVPGFAVNVLKRGGLGRLHGKMVSILPAQCVSAATAAHEVLLRPMKGVTGKSLVREGAYVLSEDVEVKKRMDTLYLVRLEGGEAKPLEWGIGLCRELAKADGYIILSRGAHKRGEIVRVVMLAGRGP